MCAAPKPSQISSKDANDASASLPLPAPCHSLSREEAEPSKRSELVIGVLRSSKASVCSTGERDIRGVSVTPTGDPPAAAAPLLPLFLLVRFAHAVERRQRSILPKYRLIVGPSSWPQNDTWFTGLQLAQNLSGSGSPSALLYPSKAQHLEFNGIHKRQASVHLKL